MNELVPSNLTIPAHLANRIGVRGPSSLSQDLLAGLSSGSPPRISIRAGRFRIVEGGAESVLPDSELNVMILKSNPAIIKTYYGKSYDPSDSGGAPDCFSTDGKQPDPAVPSPQADSCAACPMAAWGSKISPTGAKIKACTDSKRLAVVAASDPGGKVYQLSVPAASLKSMTEYVQVLLQRGLDTDLVKTKIYFDLKADFPRLLFKYGGFIEEQEAALIAHKLETAGHEIDGLLGMTASVPQLAAPAPTVAGLAAPTPAPTPAPDPEPVAPSPFAPQPAATPAPQPVVQHPEPAAAPVAAAPAAAAPAADNVDALASEIEALVSSMEPDD